MPRPASNQTLSWLRSRPTLKELCEAFPEQWAIVQREIVAAAADNDQARLHHLLKPANKAKAGFRQRNQEQHALAEVRRRMATLEIERRSLSLAAGKTSGKIRFNLFNGFIAQRLLFKRGFERKPVSMFWFRLLWPLLWQRRMLMPLVKQRGIYCFYSRELVKALTGLVGKRPCLEIAAGDGTLSRFLSEAGGDIRATDDYSWRHDVSYPESVQRMDARTALEHYSPEVVLCSWPPAGNDFERQVFRTLSVSTYVVILSRQRHAAGNWHDYESQTDFAYAEAEALSRLVLPPELGSVVYVFTRKTKDNND